MKYTISKTVLILFLYTISINILAVTIDGKLEEPEWQTAQEFSQFTTVLPYTLNTPEHETKVKIWSNTDGIYIGFTNFQPLKSQNTKRSARDNSIDADYNTVIIDFDGTAISAYGFYIGNGGSIQDGIWYDENKYNSDWDGAWYAKTYSGDNYWSTEILIPWDVVPMQSVNKPYRTIGLYFSRDVVNLSKTYASVASTPNRHRFISKFTLLQINNFEHGSLDIFPYISGRLDNISHDVDENAGVDIFWRPDSNQQLSMSINPDFGQIESDNLVVNFSPNETFFGEKRPFFTENQGLFELRGNNGLRLIHTRRIGGAPSAGQDDISDIIGAVKWTDNRNTINYGLFTAFEDDGDGSNGREFYVGRVIHKQNDTSLGYLFTYTENPDLDRTALINAFDFDINWSNKLKTKGQVISSSINHANTDINDIGMWLFVENQVNDNWQQSLELTHYGDEFEINDLGYLDRNNINELYYGTKYTINDFDAKHKVKEQEFEIFTGYRTNNQGIRLSSVVRINWQESLKNTSFWVANYEYVTPAIFDRISRGHRNVRLKEGHELFAKYHWGTLSNFRMQAGVGLTKHDADGNGAYFNFQPGYYFSDNYHLEWNVFYYDQSDWLIWQYDSFMGRYDKKQIDHSINFNANISDKQELRVKFQWVSLSAKAQYLSRITDKNQLQNVSDEIEDITFSQTLLQIRYLYEIAPLSNLYLVYSRGGNYNLNEYHQPQSLFTEGWHNKDAEHLIVKLRYRF